MQKVDTSQNGQSQFQPSATALITYILDQAQKNNFLVTVADADIESARKKINDHSYGRAIWLDASKPIDRRDVIARHDVVVSLLPPQMHLEVAQDCITLGKHMAANRPNMGRSNFFLIILNLKCKISLGHFYAKS